MLTSRFAMWIGWGRELTFFYNDAYRAHDARRQASLGARAGRRARCGRRSGSDIGPRIERVLATGAGHLGRGAAALPRAQRLPRGDLPHVLVQPARRRRRAASAGMLCVVTEETERVIGERRLRTAARPRGARSRRAKPEAEVLQPARSRSRPNGRDLPFALTYLFDDGGDARAPALASTGIERGHAAAPVDARGCDDAAGRGRWPRSLASAARRASTTLAARFAALPTRRVGPCRRAGASLVPIAQRGAGSAPAGVPGRRAQPVPAVRRRRIAGFVEPGRRADRGRPRERARLRGGAPARRGAGRARPRQDGVLLQREPRVPHAAHAACSGRWRTRSPTPRRVLGETARALEAGAPQRAAPAQAGQHAARLLAHRGRARAGASTSRPTSPRSPPTSRAASAPRCERAGLRLRGRLRRRCRAGATSTARCGRRSSSTCSRTRSSSRSTGRSRCALRAADAGAPSWRSATRASGISAERAAARLRALPPRAKARGPARTRAPASGWRWCRSWCGCTAGRIDVDERGRTRHARFTRHACRSGAAHLPAGARRAPRGARADRRPAPAPSSRRRCAGSRTRPSTPPRRLTAAGEPAHARGEPAPAARAHPVADDNADMRDYVARLLARSARRSRRSPTAPQALARGARAAPGPGR